MRLYLLIQLCLAWVSPPGMTEDYSNLMELWNRRMAGDHGFGEILDTIEEDLRNNLTLRHEFDQRLKPKSPTTKNCREYLSTWDCCADSQCQLCYHGILLKVLTRVKPELLNPVSNPLLFSGYECAQCGLLKDTIMWLLSTKLNMTSEQIKALIDHFNLWPETQYEPNACPPDLANRPPVPTLSPSESSAKLQNRLPACFAILAAALLAA